MYLSDVLRQYAKRRFPLAKSDEEDPPKQRANRGTVREFLAEKIASCEVLVFDVYRLDLIPNFERYRLVAHLQDKDINKCYAGLGFAFGVDYCLDQEGLHAVLDRYAAPRSIRPVIPLGYTVPAVVGPPQSPAISVHNEAPAEDDDEIDEDRVSREKALFKAQCLVKIQRARLDAKHRYLSGPGRGSLVERQKKIENLRVATSVNAKSYKYQSQYFYLEGKFNVDGNPAVWLDTERDVQAVEDKKLQQKIETQQRNENWQRDLERMYESGPHNGKSHKDLCEALAKDIKEKQPPSKMGEKEISSGLIRRVTRDPGERKPGGRRLKRL